MHSSEGLTGKTGQTRQVEQFEQEKHARQAVQTEQIEQAVRYRNPIAESLWPTLPIILAGPFHRRHLYGCALPWDRGLQSSRLPRKPNNQYAANGFPVSACS
jgi:hypothetical protein